MDSRRCLAEMAWCRRPYWSRWCWPGRRFCCSHQGAITCPSAPARGVAAAQHDRRQQSSDYLAQGMTDELITDLARISSLRVVSHTSVQQYADTSKSLSTIAAELDVDAIVEWFSVMRIAERHPRASYSLLDARHDRHIWADVLERNMGDATSMQQELAEQIAAQIGVQLTPFEKQYFAGRHAVSSESFGGLFARSRYYWNKRTPGWAEQGGKLFQGVGGGRYGQSAGLCGACRHVSVGQPLQQHGRFRHARKSARGCRACARAG